MKPFMFQILALLGAGDIGKPKVPVAGLTLDTTQRAGEVVGTSSDQVRRTSISGENVDTRRSFFDKEMMVSKTEGPRNCSSAAYPIPPSSWLNGCAHVLRTD